MAGALAIVPGDPRADGVVPAATNRCGGAGVDVEAPTGVAQIGGRASRRPSVTRSRALYDHVLIDNLIATAAPNEDVADWLDLGPTLVVTTEADARAAGYRRSQRRPTTAGSRNPGVGLTHAPFGHEEWKRAARR